MSTSDILPSRELLAFQMFDWLNVAQGEECKALLAVIDTAQRLAVDAFMPHYRQGDIEEPELRDGRVHILPEAREAIASFAKLGLFGTSFPEELGGFGLPFTATLAIQATFAAANVSTANYAMLTAANARLISAFGTPEQIEQFASPEIEGRWLGTMCLSEPQAGSSLGDIRTKAVPDGRDELGERYRLTGNKMWISGGDQDATDNIVHLVLAKVVSEDGSLPAGSKGTSLFIVPKILPDGSANDIVVAGLNHKLGNRGTTNCLLNFGEQDGATGWLIGEPGQGLAQMFTMMNEARISVGVNAAALAYRGYRQSVRYARDRTQGRAPGEKRGEQIAIVEHVDVRRMLLQQKTYAEGALALCLYCAHLVDRDDDESETLLALLTPVAKSWPSEFGLIANDLAIQVHAGYGYTRDFDVEQLWRDNRLNPIHEGTTGIQAIDLLGRKLLFSDGRALGLLRTRMEETVALAREGSDYEDQSLDLMAFLDAIDSTLQRLKDRDKHAFDDATMFLRAFGHGVVAWLWLDQAVRAAGLPETPHLIGLRQTCRFFFENELPQVQGWIAIVSRNSNLVRDTPSEAFD